MMVNNITDVGRSNALAMSFMAILSALSDTMVGYIT